MSFDKAKTGKLLSTIAAVVAVVVVICLIVNDEMSRDFDTFSKSDIAMGTVVSYKLYGDEQKNELSELNKLVADTENSISRLIDTSYVSVLNSVGSVENAELRDIALVCMDVYNSSAGAFDVTVGAVSSLWDIGGENARVPSKQEISSALKLVDGSLMSISGETVSIAKGQYVDMGAVGKGYACDKAYDYLKGTDVRGAVISVGGSILLYGTHNKMNDTWRVAVRDPFASADQYAGVLEMAEGFVSTSGDYERTLTVDGVTYHHIIDPSTGYPADSGLSSVTVTAKSGILSDALSTACLVMGKEKSMALLEMFSAEAVFIYNNRSIYITDGLRDSFEPDDGYKLIKNETES